MLNPVVHKVTTRPCRQTYDNHAQRHAKRFAWHTSSVQKYKSVAQSFRKLRSFRVLSNAAHKSQQWPTSNVAQSHNILRFLQHDSSLLICGAVPLGELFHLSEFTLEDEDSGSRETSARDTPFSKPAEMNYSTSFGREAVAWVYSKRRLHRKEGTRERVRDGVGVGGKPHLNFRFRISRTAWNAPYSTKSAKRLSKQHMCMDSSTLIICTVNILPFATNGQFSSFKNVDSTNVTAKEI